MTHDELLAKIDSYSCCSGMHEIALCAVVELHKPELMIVSSYCVACTINLEIVPYPCPTIQAIEKELM
jgi:hypothetical protein